MALAPVADVVSVVAGCPVLCLSSIVRQAHQPKVSLCIPAVVPLAFGASRVAAKPAAIHPVHVVTIVSTLVARQSSTARPPARNSVGVCDDRRACELAAWTSGWLVAGSLSGGPVAVSVSAVRRVHSHSMACFSCWRVPTAWRRVAEVQTRQRAAALLAPESVFRPQLRLCHSQSLLVADACESR